MKLHTLIMAILLSLWYWAPAGAQEIEDWRTDYEKSNFLQTPRYPETIAYCKRLAAASPWVDFQTFGFSPQGRDLPLLVLSNDGAFTPDAARRTGKAVVLIQSGIHAGEIDGKDASLMLAREIAVTKSMARFLDQVIVLIAPILAEPQPQPGLSQGGRSRDEGHARTLHRLAPRFLRGLPRNERHGLSV
jgi:hypothetical protein